jgi:hypothetical protein
MKTIIINRAEASNDFEPCLCSFNFVRPSDGEDNYRPEKWMLVNISCSWEHVAYHHLRFVYDYDNERWLCESSSDLWQDFWPTLTEEEATKYRNAITNELLEDFFNWKQFGISVTL